MSGNILNKTVEFHNHPLIDPISQSSTGNLWQGYEKRYLSASDSVKKLSSQCSLTVQIEQVQDKKVQTLKTNISQFFFPVK